MSMGPRGGMQKQEKCDFKRPTSQVCAIQTAWLQANHRDRKHGPLIIYELLPNQPQGAQHTKWAWRYPQGRLSPWAPAVTPLCVSSLIVKREHDVNTEQTQP